MTVHCARSTDYDAHMGTTKQSNSCVRRSAPCITMRGTNYLRWFIVQLQFTLHRLNLASSQDRNVQGNHTSLNAYDVCHHNRISWTVYHTNLRKLAHSLPAADFSLRALAYVTLRPPMSMRPSTSQAIDMLSSTPCIYMRMHTYIYNKCVYCHG